MLISKNSRTKIKISCSISCSLCRRIGSPQKTKGFNPINKKGQYPKIPAYWLLKCCSYPLKEFTSSNISLNSSYRGVLLQTIVLFNVGSLLLPVEALIVIFDLLIFLRSLPIKQPKSLFWNVWNSSQLKWLVKVSALLLLYKLLYSLYGYCYMLR